jgi:hypothetical protein
MLQSKRNWREIFSWRKDLPQRIEVTEENMVELEYALETPLYVGDIIYLNDQNQFHNPNGPAIERQGGTKRWYTNGLRHRLDGPAIEYADGTKRWGVNDKFIGNSRKGFTEEDFENYKREMGITSSLKLKFII